MIYIVFMLMLVFNFVVFAILGSLLIEQAYIRRTPTIVAEGRGVVAGTLTCSDADSTKIYAAIAQALYSRAMAFHYMSDDKSAAVFALPPTWVWGAYVSLRCQPLENGCEFVVRTGAKYGVPVNRALQMLAMGQVRTALTAHGVAWEAHEK